MDPYINPEALDPNHPLTPRKLDNLKRADRAYQNLSIKVDASPSKITFQTTERCNLRCPYCQIPYAQKKRAMPKEMLDLLKQKLLSDLIELHPTNIGEPFMWPHFQQLCKDMEEYGVLLDLTTNGTMLTPERIEWIAPIARDVKISLDGAQASTHERLRPPSSFKHILKNTHRLVQRLKKVRIRRPIIAFQMTLMAFNVDELPDLIKLAADIGVDRVKAYHLFSFRPELDSWSLVHHLEHYENEILPKSLELGHKLGVDLQLAEPSGGNVQTLQKRICFLPWHETWFDLDGSILVCHSHHGHRAGTLDDFENAWNGPLYQSIRKGFASGHPIGSCAGCGMNYAKPSEHMPVPFDPSSFLSSSKNHVQIRWSGRMKQFDLQGRR